MLSEKYITLNLGPTSPKKMAAPLSLTILTRPLQLTLACKGLTSHGKSNGK